MTESFKFLSILIIFMLLAIFSLATSAHTLEETTARISLRDGQVEVRIWVDMNNWQGRLQDTKAWLLGDSQQVMPLGLTSVKRKAYIKKILHEQILLTLNEQPISLELLDISEPKNKTKHHEYTELILSSKHNFSTVEKLKINFPKSLGAVYASFVKPKYKMIVAGSSAKVSFSKLD